MKDEKDHSYPFDIPAAAFLMPGIFFNLLFNSHFRGLSMITENDNKKQKRYHLVIDLLFLSLVTLLLFVVLGIIPG